MNSDYYSSDIPIVDYKFDQFNRYPFAKRVAEVISKREDPSSIVIGIYGVWGEGKTSVFNFIENELTHENDIVCLKFNPWRFGDEDEMLVNYFTELATAIDKSIGSTKEKVGDAIEKYGKPLASFFNRGDFAEGVRSFFSKADVDELRKRIEDLLEQAKKRVVILVDDIDRLEKNEIHAIFRLVKLTADFKYTAYILAFDKQVVSTALQERYGSADVFGTGNSFLEKIIQVPLNLPSADNEDLKAFCFGEINRVIELLQIELSQKEVNMFVSNFSKGLEMHIKTPRQAKLYSNILMFSIPILKDEVNIVDLMLIEGIRVLLPTTYSFIKINKNLFLEGNSRGLNYENDQAEKKRKKDIIEKNLEPFPVREKENIIDLLCFLFPKLNNIFKNVTYGDDWETKWSEKKRISSPQYFQRYFSYAINKRDFSDITLDELLEDSKLFPIDDIVSKIKMLITDSNAKTFISKLRSLSYNFTAEQSKTLAISVARLGSTLPNPVELFRSFNTYGQSAIFTSDCIENLKEKQGQIKLAKEVITNAGSLSFAAECFMHFRRDTKEHPNPQGFSEEEYDQVGKFFAERISKEFPEDTFSEFENLPHLLHVWAKHKKHEVVSSVIDEKIRKDKYFIFSLLDSYTATAFGDFGSKKSNFRRNNYESIIEILDPIMIVQAIKEVFNDIKLNDQYPEFLEVSRNEELAHQFLWLHYNIENIE